MPSQARAINSPYDVEATADGIYTSAITWMYLWIAMGLVVIALAERLAHQLGVWQNVGLLGNLLVVAICLLFLLIFGVQRLPSPITVALYLGFTAVLGVLISFVSVVISYIFATNTGETVVLAFGLTAAVFAAMSIIGFTTKRDLSKWGLILLFGLLGTVIVSLINNFIGSGLLSWAVTVVALPLFLGSVIWERKEVKEKALEAAAIGDTKAAQKIGIIGAVGVYLNICFLSSLDWTC